MLLQTLVPLHSGPELVSTQRHIQGCFHELWKAYQSEYLTTLQRYRKSKSKTHEYQEGDYVHILQGEVLDAARRTLPTPMRTEDSRYALGRIQKVYEGRDGQDRKYDVMRHGKIKQYSYMSLAPLFL